MCCFFCWRCSGGMLFCVCFSGVFLCVGLFFGLGCFLVVLEFDVFMLVVWCFFVRFSLLIFFWMFFFCVMAVPKFLFWFCCSLFLFCLFFLVSLSGVYWSRASPRFVAGLVLLSGVWFCLSVCFCVVVGLVFWFFSFVGCCCFFLLWFFFWFFLCVFV